MDQLLRLSDRVMYAIKAGDQAVFEEVLTEDFVHLEGDKEIGREEFIASVAKVAPMIEGIRFETIWAEQMAEAGIVAGIQHATVLLPAPDNRRAISRSAFTDVFVQVEGEWKLKFAHTSSLGTE